MAIADLVAQEENADRAHFESLVKGYAAEHGLKIGDLFPIFRLALTGTMQGPDLLTPLPSWVERTPLYASITYSANA